MKVITRAQILGFHGELFHVLFSILAVEHDAYSGRINAPMLWPCAEYM